MNTSAAFLATATAAFSSLLGAPTNAAGSLLIENVTLISPEQPQPLGNRYVLIRDGRFQGALGLAMDRGLSTALRPEGRAIIEHGSDELYALTMAVAQGAGRAGHEPFSSACGWASSRRRRAAGPPRARGQATTV